MKAASIRPLGMWIQLQASALYAPVGLSSFHAQHAKDLTGCKDESECLATESPKIYFYALGDRS